MQNSKNNSQNRDIKIRAYEYALSLIFFIDTVPLKRSTAIITNQLLRAGTSIGANIIEA